ncbi:MAG: hypothetical protein RLZZ28_1382 [Bacteroidota bacterium]
MSDQISYKDCPCCSSTNIFPVVTAKDYTVSGELFEIWHCKACTARFTQHIPLADKIGAYYQSANYISHSDTQKGLVNRLYHIVRKLTLKSKRKLIEKNTLNGPGKIVEVGAGTGAFSQTMQEAGWEVIGIEPDASARELAYHKFGLSLHPAEKLFQLQPLTSDAITMWHVLEHVHDLKGYLRQFHAVLKKGGKLVIAVPNYTSYDAIKYGACWAAYDVPRHLYHFSPKSMEMLGNASGFRLSSVKPMWFDSFYVAMLSEQYKNGKTGLLAAVWNGLLSNFSAVLNTRKCSSVIYVFVKD